MTESEIWELDLENWDLETQCKWGEALKQSQDGYSPRPLVPIMMKVVKRWPFPGSPTRARDWFHLSMAQWREAFKRVSDAVLIFLED